MYINCYRKYTGIERISSQKHLYIDVLMNLICRWLVGCVLRHIDSEVI